MTTFRHHVFQQKRARTGVLVGRLPLRYHNEWRLTLARDMLVRREAKLGEITLGIGYESETAFSRAYKTLLGHPPRQAAGHDARLANRS